MGQQQSTPSIPTTPVVEVPKHVDSTVPVAGCPVKAKTEGNGECANCANKATEQPAKAECPMRAKQDGAVATQAIVEQPKSGCPMKSKSTTPAEPASGGGCPMKSKQEPAKVESLSAAPASTNQTQAPAAPECPVRTKKDDDKYVNPNVYNVRKLFEIY